jgi:hypothetical protein
MPLPGPSHPMQKIADYRTIRKSLKSAGIWSIVFGAVALVMGLMPPTEWILATLGLVLLGTGVWNIAAPRPVGVIADGVTLLMVGVYNLVFTVLALTQGGSSGSHWVMLGVLQLVWGGRRIASYRRFASAFDQQPSDAELNQLDALVDSVRKAKTKESQDVIEIAVEGVHRQNWKAKLSGSEALFVEVAGHDVFFGTRESVNAENRGKVMIGNAVKVTIDVSGHVLKGTMSSDAWRTWEQWKTGIVVPKAFAA